MKNIYFILLAICLMGTACKENEPTEKCNINNPLTDLPWLKEKIEEFQNTPDIMVFIYQCVFENEEIGFLVKKDGKETLYNCKGEIYSEQDIVSKELIWEIVLGNYPVEVPFTRYSLDNHWIDEGRNDPGFDAGGDKFCELCCWWTNLNYNNSIIIINSEEELKKYINCSNTNYPEIDFSKHTLLLANGRSPNTIYELSKHLLQPSKNKYRLDIEIRQTDSNGDGSWVVALIANKLSEESNVELDVTIIEN